MIDEAQHFGRWLRAANRTNTAHVLFGTYDLLAFRNLSGQLSRRSVDVHFPRYRADLAGDHRILVNIVHSFQKKLPLPEPPNLVEHWEFLYERSFGCVGVLKQWLVKELADALRRGDATVSIRNLEAHALSMAQCDKILSEIIEGELARRCGIALETSGAFGLGRHRRGNRIGASGPGMCRPSA
ncbi:MAG: hypothetical protein ACR2NN_12490 [Bryobacteraceae bacterium]